MDDDSRRGPADWLNADQSWPAGRLRAHAPLGVHVDRAIAVNLQLAMNDTAVSLPELAGSTGVSIRLLRDIVAGTAHASISDVAVIERALGLQIWPSRKQLELIWAQINEPPQPA